MSGYTVEPPSYSQPAAKKAYGATQTAPDQEPLLSGNAEASGSHAPRNDWAAEGEADDVPDDFKVGRLAGHACIATSAGQADTRGATTDWHHLVPVCARDQAAIRSQSVWSLVYTDREHSFTSEFPAGHSS